MGKDSGGDYSDISIDELKPGYKAMMRARKKAAAKKPKKKKKV